MQNNKKYFKEVKFHFVKILNDGRIVEYDTLFLNANGVHSVRKGFSNFLTSVISTVVSFSKLNIFYVINLSSLAQLR